MLRYQLRSTRPHYHQHLAVVDRSLEEENQMPGFQALSVGLALSVLPMIYRQRRSKESKKENEREKQQP